jgi:hypothetical protein
MNNLTSISMLVSGRLEQERCRFFQTAQDTINNNVIRCTIRT